MIPRVLHNTFACAAFMQLSCIYAAPQRLCSYAVYLHKCCNAVDDKKRTPKVEKRDCGTPHKRAVGWDSIVKFPQSRQNQKIISMFFNSIFSGKRFCVHGFGRRSGTGKGPFQSTQASVYHRQMRRTAPLSSCALPTSVRPNFRNNFPGLPHGDRRAIPRQAIRGFPPR